jgi:hypothetical protein
VAEVLVLAQVNSDQHQHGATIVKMKNFTAA